MSELTCSESRELLPAIAAGAPVSLARRGEALHHAEGCTECRGRLSLLRSTWQALGPDLHPDPEPGAQLDPMVTRAVHLARALESSVTAIPIVVPRERGEPPARRLRPAWRAALAAAAAAGAALALWVALSRPDLGGLGRGPAERVGATMGGLPPEDQVALVESALLDHPDDPELWRLLGQAAADAADADALCRGYVRYLTLRPDAPDRAQVIQFTADRLASLGRSGLCSPGAAAPAAPATAATPAR